RSSAASCTISTSRPTSRINPHRGQPPEAALFSALYDDRLFMCPALRRREICVAISAALIAVLGFAIFVHLSLLASMRPDVVSVFFRALALSGMLAIVTVSLLWLLERRGLRTPPVFPLS